MNQGVIRRTVLLTAAVLAVLAFVPLVAQAAPCPAEIPGFEPVNPQRTLFGFRLTSGEHGEIAGDVAVDTDRGWFRIPIAPMRLSQLPTRRFASSVLYARFLQPVAVRRSWFESDGAACYPPLAMQREDDPALRGTPPNGAVVIQAQVREPYGRTECAEPFAPVRALNIVEPVFSRKNATFPGNAGIDVTVGADGKVQDASIVRNSGTPSFDDAALDAARKSTYAPAIAYCLPEPGRYFYEATLRP